MPRTLDDVFPLDAAAANFLVSVTSARIALPSSRQTIRVVNLGALPVFINAGTNSVLASVGNPAIAANGGGLFKVDPTVQTHIAAISESSVVRLNIAADEGRFN